MTLHISAPAMHSTNFKMAADFDLTNKYMYITSSQKHTKYRFLANVCFNIDAKLLQHSQCHSPRHTRLGHKLQLLETFFSVLKRRLATLKPLVQAVRRNSWLVSFLKVKTAHYLLLYIGIAKRHGCSCQRSAGPASKNTQNTQKIKLLEEKLDCHQWHGHFKNAIRFFIDK